MKIYTIYKATNKSNGKSYLGFDSKWPNRMNQHKRNYLHKNLKFYDAIKKYGWDNFDWSIVYQSIDGNHTLNCMENFFIEEYDSFRNGYNMTLGGEGALGYKPTPEHILKNKMKNSGANHANFGKHLSNSTKQKISEKNSGSNNGNFGKKLIFSEKHKKKFITFF